MKFSLPKRRFKLLGIAQDRSVYDFPFQSDTGNRFLFLLIALMTYLALLAAAGGLTLTGMADRWTDGVRGHMTVEIPPFDRTGTAIAPTILDDKIKSLMQALKSQPGIERLELRPQKEVAKLVEPWLGKSDLLLGQVPLPVLIGIHLETDAPDLVQKITAAAQGIIPDAIIETHQGWLNDVLRLTNTLSFTAYLIGIVTLVTTVFAVAGAVRARMVAYHEQLELLHLIGARDEYIVRQFQKHALMIAFKAAGLGLLLALLTLLLIDQISGSVAISLVPALVLPGSSFLMLLCIPVLACMLTMLTARMTVLQALRSMT